EQLGGDELRAFAVVGRAGLAHRPSLGEVAASDRPQEPAGPDRVLGRAEAAERLARHDVDRGALPLLGLLDRGPAVAVARGRHGPEPGELLVEGPLGGRELGHLVGPRRTLGHPLLDLLRLGLVGGRQSAEVLDLGRDGGGLVLEALELGAGHVCRFRA
ncbi:MAG: hypothetical protein ACK559_35510, partial [bacterium]